MSTANEIKERDEMPELANTCTGRLSSERPLSLSASTGPILHISNEGVFTWDALAEKRIESDSFTGNEANRHILRALWRLKCLDESL